MARPIGSGVKPVISRLKSRTTVDSSGCWLWGGSLTHNGYGQINVQGRAQRVHRVSYEMHCGEIPSGALVLHTCDQRQCWNPDHLFLGDEAENTQDMMRKGRHRHGVSPGESNPNALCTVEQVRSIRSDQRRLVDIAKDHGIHFTTVSDIRRGKSWRHVDPQPFDGVSE